jgi:hypothetical protein
MATSPKPFSDADLTKINAALMKVADVKEFLLRVGRAGLDVSEQLSVLELYETQLGRLKAEFWPQAR